jgi:hypothetical protein
MGEIAFETDGRLGVRIATLRGEIDDLQLLAAYRRLTADRDFDARIDDLVDLREVSPLRVTADGLRELIAVLRRAYRHKEHRKVAIVAPSELAFGMARMYQLLRGVEPPEEIRVFHQYPEAIAWLRTTG